MFEILQHICGYNSDKMAKGKKNVTKKINTSALIDMR